MQPRLEGLAVLLGVSVGELDPTNYPVSVQLPNEIHQPAQEALQQTLGDGRERQLSYGYKSGPWTVGVETGPKTDILETKDGKIYSRGLLQSIYHSVLKRPLVALHTHPLMGDEVITAVMARHQDRESWGAQETEDWYNHYRAAANLNTSFPSPEDVRVAHARRPKELVHMLYTPFSAFMIVRNSLSGKRESKFTSEKYLATRQAIGQYKNVVANICSGDSVDEERSKLLESLSVALCEEYSLFYSFDEPADTKPPVLEKYSGE